MTVIKNHFNRYVQDQRFNDQARARKVEIVPGSVDEFIAKIVNICDVNPLWMQKRFTEYCLHRSNRQYVKEVTRVLKNNEVKTYNYKKAKETLTTVEISGSSESETSSKSHEKESPVLNDDEGSDSGEEENQENDQEKAAEDEFDAAAITEGDCVALGMPAQDEIVEGAKDKNKYCAYALVLTLNSEEKLGTALGFKKGLGDERDRMCKVQLIKIENRDLLKELLMSKSIFAETNSKLPLSLVSLKWNPTRLDEIAISLKCVYRSPLASAYRDKCIHSELAKEAARQKAEASRKPSKTVAPKPKGSKASKKTRGK